VITLSDNEKQTIGKDPSQVSPDPLFLKLQFD
jgi:hypothetical protein